MIISHLVALSNNFVIGVNNDLPWKLKKDLQHFSAYTQNKAIVMGRKTFESIGKPLPGRANIVLTRSRTNDFNGAIVVNSFDEAITKADEWIEQKKNNSEDTVQQKIFLFGGAEIYKLGIDFCDIIHMTKVQIDIIKGTKFANLNNKEWKKTKLEEFPKTSDNPEFSYWHYQRIK